MKYCKAELVDGELVEKDCKTIPQSQLTSDCWAVQFEGLNVCETCEWRNTDECGGGETLKRLKREEKECRSKLRQ